MFLSSGAGAGPDRLGPTRMLVRGFDPAGPYESDPLLEEYLGDMTALYGRQFSRDRHERSARVSFTEMADRLVRDLGPLDGPLDLIVIAHSTPDADPRRVTACYLSELVPGDPLAFAVSDQGPAAPFTALRLLRSYAGDFPSCRALLLVLEQTSMPYEVSGARYPVPAADVGVAMLLEAGADRPITTALRPDVPAAAVAGVLAGLVPATAAVIAGAGLAGTTPLPGRPAWPSPAGFGSAGTWAALAERWATGAPAGPVAVADHDPVSGSLCVALVGADPEGAR